MRHSGWRGPFWPSLLRLLAKSFCDCQLWDIPGRRSTHLVVESRFALCLSGGLSNDDDNDDVEARWSEAVSQDVEQRGNVPESFSSAVSGSAGVPENKASDRENFDNLPRNYLPKRCSVYFK